MKATKSNSGPAPHAVQARDPITDRWVKVETRTGRVLHVKKSEGPFKRVPPAEREAVPAEKRR